MHLHPHPHHLASGHRQTLLKTVSFASVHFTVALLVGWALTGSFVLASLLALVEPACNTVAYFFHERLWQRLERRGERPPGGTPCRSAL